MAEQNFVKNFIEKHSDGTRLTGSTAVPVPVYYKKMLLSLKFSKKFVNIVNKII
jgi:hypothetical protein